jgi:hypothetical protein
MKGIVFTEFLEMVEDKFSPEIADKIIDESDLSTGGAYTAVGTYHHGELIEMVMNLSKESDLPVPALVKAFGEYLFGRFVELYPAFFENINSSFDFLELIENHVHVEVQKLYPDAELPTFETSRPSENTLKMVYQSQRPFAPLAEGLIEGCVAHYNEKVDVNINDLSEGENTHVAFELTRH